MSVTDLDPWLDSGADDLRQRLGPLRGTDDDDERVADAAARAIWSVLTEPGDGVAGSLIAAHGATEALRALRRMTPTSAVDPQLSKGMARWVPRMTEDAIEAAVRVARRTGMRIVVPGDEDWPAGLDDLGAHAPHALWVRGPGLRELDGAAGVSVIGARAATAYGERVAVDICAELAARGLIVVSGAAYGIDGAAHRAALHAGGTTIGVLAGGADRAYPTGHSQLLTGVIERGAVIAEVAPGTAPSKWRFLQRNRLIAAISQATIVVEAGFRSGSLNTAGHAATLGRPLGAVPVPVSSAASAGCHRLLREYDAICIRHADDVLELLGRPTRDPAHDAGTGGDATTALHAARAGRATDDATRVLDALSARATRSTQDLARRAGLDAADVEPLLGLLALEGLAVSADGGWRRAGGRSAESMRG